MRFDQLEMTHQYLTEILRHGRNPRLERLSYDLFNHYYQQYHVLDDASKNVWDTIINLRLKMVVVPQPQFLGNLQKLRQMYSGSMSYPSIRFGQLRADAKFQKAGVVQQEAMVGMPVISDQRVVQYGQEILVSPNMSDILPVTIFHYEGQWIAADSREFAAHCVGRTKPLRLIVRAARADEISRLNQVEGQESVPVFEYSENVSQLEKQPHSLPSKQLAITADADNCTVEEVVTIPEDWD